jgi:hypothetical protein
MARSRENFNFYGISSYEPPSRSLPSLANTTPPYLVLSFGPQAWSVRSPDLSPLECFLYGGGGPKNMVGRQKSQAREELLQWIMESTDHIKGN